jgi:integrase
MPTKKGGRWWAVVNLPRQLGEDGKVKRRQVWGGAHETKAEAVAEEVRLRYLHQQPVPLRREPTTVGQLADEWLSLAEQRVEGSTYQRYTVHVAHLKAALGRLMLDQVQERHLLEFYRRMRATKQGGGTRSETSILNLHRIVKMVFAYGVRTGRIAVNPALVVRLRPAPREVRVLNDAEMRDLHAALDGWLRPIVLLALHTGMRQGEIAALQPEDVDLEHKQLWVRHSVGFDGALKSPKNGKTRVIPLDSTCVQLLEQHQVERGRLFLQNPDSLSHAFRRVAVKLWGKANAPRFHDLRHTHASWLLREGVPLVEVSERLGHGSIAITAALYAHYIPGRGHETADRFEAAMQRALDGSGWKPGRKTAAG